MPPLVSCSAYSELTGAYVAWQGQQGLTTGLAGQNGTALSCHKSLCDAVHYYYLISGHPLDCKLQ